MPARVFAVLLSVWAAAPAHAGEAYDSGWQLILDNDAFALADRDGDYTAGLAITASGGRVVDRWYSLNPLLKASDELIGLPSAEPARHAMQFGLLAFTPKNIKTPAAPGDRPYASLLYLANSRMTFPENSATVYQSTFVLGVLGLSVAETTTRLMHAAIDTNQARGWDQQISDGGELTFRYSLARLGLLSAGEAGSRRRYELKYGASANAGYLTETAASLSFRWGRIQTPWWSFTPELGAYVTDPVPAAARSPQERYEFYGWGGIKAHARHYSAFLQGQMRDSALSYHRRETRSLIGEAWLGLTADLDGGYNLSWVIRGQTSELRTELGDRKLLWGSVILSRSF